MESLQMQDAYYSFIKEHRNKITSILNEEYKKFLDHPKQDVLWRVDFGGCVGIPLLIIGILWMISTKFFNHWLIAAILIGFGFWLRYYQKHTVAVACRQFFNWGKGKETLDEYILQCKDAALREAPETEYSTISQFYEYCRKNLWPHEFRYYK